MLELYHSINSVCAQKVRIALEEKGQKATDRLMTLRGDQFEPAYLKLNPGGVVPTLIHDGEPIIESSLILYYVDDAFPEPPLMPKSPRQRHRVRMYNKLIDEYVHNSCMILTFATAFRPAFLKMAPEAWQAEIAKSPLKRRAEYKRSVIEHGLDSEFVADALTQHRKLLSWMAELAQKRPVPGRRSLLQCGLRRNSLYPAARTAQARRHLGPLPGGRRLVGTRARTAIGQDRDLRSHDRGGHRTVQKSRARSLAQGEGIAEGCLNNLLVAQTRLNSMAGIDGHPEALQSFYIRINSVWIHLCDCRGNCQCSIYARWKFHEPLAQIMDYCMGNDDTFRSVSHAVYSQGR